MGEERCRCNADTTLLRQLPASRQGDVQSHPFSPFRSALPTSLTPRQRVLPVCAFFTACAHVDGTGSRSVSKGVGGCNAQASEQPPCALNHPLPNPPPTHSASQQAGQQGMPGPSATAVARSVGWEHKLRRQKAEQQQPSRSELCAESRAPQIAKKKDSHLVQLLGQLLACQRLGNDADAGHKLVVTATLAHATGDGRWCTGVGIRKHASKLTHSSLDSAAE